MNLNIQQSKKVAADDFKAKYVKFTDEADAAGPVVSATGVERSGTLAAPTEQTGGGTRGRFPEFAGFWDDPAETVIKLTGLGTADPGDVKPDRARRGDDPRQRLEMILLDTHILIWFITNNTEKLSASAMGEIGTAMAQGDAAVSAATFWELEVKRRKTRRHFPTLQPTGYLRSAMLAEGLEEIAVSGSLWIEAVGLIDEMFHQDPADQLIVATAIRHEYRLLTMDSRISAWAKRTGRTTLLAHNGTT